MNVTPADTLRREALERRNEAIDREVIALHAEKAKNTEAITLLVMASRPTYPTDAHRAGIAEAARRCREHAPYDSHHGDPCGPESDRYAVVCTPDNPAFRGGKGSFINVRSEGTNYSERLWVFGQSDIDALLDLIEAEGLTLREHWACDGGHSIVVDPLP